MNAPRRSGPRGGARAGRGNAGNTQPGRGNARTQSAGKPKRAADAQPHADARRPAPIDRTPFLLGATEGATPGTWIDRWRERMPRTPLVLVPLELADQRAALAERRAEAAIVRLPVERDGTHLIPLYEETMVAVCAADSHLTAAAELTTADLDGETLITATGTALLTALSGTAAASFGPLETTADAVATVASGVGIAVMPMSLARLHHRKDVEFRPVPDLPTSPVGLAWEIDRANDRIETFVGIVRGRTSNSSRS